MNIEQYVACGVAMIIRMFRLPKSAYQMEKCFMQLKVPRSLVIVNIGNHPIIRFLLNSPYLYTYSSYLSLQTYPCHSELQHIVAQFVASYEEQFVPKNINKSMRFYLQIGKKRSFMTAGPKLVLWYFEGSSSLQSRLDQQTNILNTFTIIQMTPTTRLAMVRTVKPHFKFELIERSTWVAR